MPLTSKGYDGRRGAPDFEADRKRLRHQLISRPLTCVAQRNVLENLLRLGGSDAEQTRWSARLAFLCGPSVLSPWLVPGPDVAPCDDTDWCRRPPCALDTEACALSWAARPTTTCTHASGVRAALPFACARFLRGEGTEARVRALSNDAWCLKRDALKERDELNTRNAPKESP